MFSYMINVSSWSAFKFRSISCNMFSPALVTLKVMQLLASLYCPSLVNNWVKNLTPQMNTFFSLCSTHNPQKKSNHQFGNPHVLPRYDWKNLCTSKIPNWIIILKAHHANSMSFIVQWHKRSDFVLQLQQRCRHSSLLYFHMTRALDPLQFVASLQRQFTNSTAEFKILSILLIELPELLINTSK